MTIRPTLDGEVLAVSVLTRVRQRRAVASGARTGAMAA